MDFPEMQLWNSNLHCKKKEKRKRDITHLAPHCGAQRGTHLRVIVNLISELQCIPEMLYFVGAQQSGNPDLNTRLLVGEDRLSEVRSFILA